MGLRQHTGTILQGVRTGSSCYLLSPHLLRHLWSSLYSRVILSLTSWEPSKTSLTSWGLRKNALSRQPNTCQEPNGSQLHVSGSLPSLRRMGREMLDEQADRWTDSWMDGYPGGWTQESYGPSIFHGQRRKFDLRLKWGHFFLLPKISTLCNQNSPVSLKDSILRSPVKPQALSLGFPLELT